LKTGKPLDTGRAAFCLAGVECRGFETKRITSAVEFFLCWLSHVLLHPSLFTVKGVEKMDQQSPEQVVNTILKGNVDEYACLVQRFQSPIFRYCYHMLGHREEAEDASQEVFWKAYRHLNTYKTNVPFAAWLYKIAYHHCIDVLRKRKLSTFLPLLFRSEKQHSPVDQHIEDVYFSEAVYLSMMKLSAEERTLLILRGVEEKPFDEISMILKKNAASLRKKYERTAAKFRLYYSQAKGGEEKNETEACRMGY
jgi:RNA polymerase sigma factor (sigma-70 family)